MSIEEPKKPAKTASSRKIEANRKNAQHSTGPKTDEGKAKSSHNSIKHGIFVTKFLNGATPDTTAEIQELAAGLREHYEPKGILEEILVQKIVVETARYGRVLALEHLSQDTIPRIWFTGSTRSCDTPLRQAARCITPFKSSNASRLYGRLVRAQLFPQVGRQQPVLPRATKSSLLLTL